jgi:NAD(P)H dehydrogenase (quinone)
MSSPNPSTLAVTGSTGYLGGLVARHLADENVAARLLARDPARAPRLPGAVAVTSRYADDAETRSSLEGVGAVFMVSASESADRVQQHRAFIDAAAAAGVRHIVYTSFFGAAPDAIFTLARDHWATEQHIVASGMTYTFLRDNFYIDVLPSFVGDDGVIRGPAGEGKVAAVARTDVARAAANVLSHPEAHENTTYDLTGPEALTMTEVAAILTQHTGRPIAFHNETIPEAYESRRRWEAAPWQYDAWVSTYTAIAEGELVPVSDDVERITGRRPLTLAQFLRLEQA